MNVAFFLDDLKTGGVQKRTLRLISGLVKFNQNSNFNIDLIVNNPKGDLFSLVDKNVNLHILNGNNYLSSWLKLKVMLNNIKPDIVVACMGQQFIQAYFVKKVTNLKFKLVVIQAVPIYLPAYSYITNFLRKLLISIFYTKADRVSCVSEDVRKSVLRANPKLTRNSVTIYNPVIDSYIYDLANKKFSHPFLQGDSIALVSVGRLHIQKNYSNLIRALKIARENSQLDLKLIIIGGGQLKNSLEALIDELGLKQDVDLLGFKSNPYPYVAKSDLFVMSSLWEGLPNALIEAIALGTKVVSTDCIAGPREILEEGKYGRLAELESSESLAVEILKELKTDRDVDVLKRRGMCFSIERSSLSYLKLFGDLTNECN